MKKTNFVSMKMTKIYLGLEIPYLSAINAFIFLANSTQTRRHCNDIKDVLRYLCGTINMSLFYSNKSKSQLFGYVNSGYLSNPYKTRSRTNRYAQMII